MDADPVAQHTLRGSTDVEVGQSRLHLHGALHGIDSTRELSEDTVTGGVGDPAAMLRNETVHNLTMSRKISQGADLILAHQTRVAGHVSSQDRGQTPLDAFGLRVCDLNGPRCAAVRSSRDTPAAQEAGRRAMLLLVHQMGSLALSPLSAERQDASRTSLPRRDWVRHLIPDGRDLLEVGVDGFQIVVGHLSDERPGHGRQDLPTLALMAAGPQGLNELLFAEVAQHTGVWVRREVC
jgi:hypothetical protein